MSIQTLGAILAVVLALNLIMDLVYAWRERLVMRMFDEVLDVLVPALEDIRRLDPHLDESIELAMVRTIELQPRVHAMANGYITPIGLIPRRKRKGQK